MRLGCNLAMQFGVLDATDRLPTLELLAAAIRDRAAMGFEHVEIAAQLFTIYPELATREAIEQLRKLKEELNLTFSLHLHNGLGVDLDSWAERIRRAAVEETIAIYEATRPLEVNHFALHTVWGYIMAHDIVRSQRLSTEMKDILLSRIREQSRRSLAELVRVIPSRSLCLENLFVDFEWVYPLVEEFDTSICFDGGHWHLLGHQETEFAARYGHRVTLVHCHDVKEEKDHQPLIDPLTIDWKTALEALRQKGFDGPVVLELSTTEDARVSLPVLKKVGGV